MPLEACNGCGLCEICCAYDAIHIVDHKARLDVGLCERCGLCVTCCRPGALTWEAV